jgi:5-(carboxyamino)imidazole ribonucleotide synthase
VAVLDPSFDCPAASVCDELIVAGLNEPQGYLKLAEKSDVITYEWENISITALENLEKQGNVIYPTVSSLKAVQNKYAQKKLFERNNIPVPRLELVSGIQDIKVLARDSFGYPLVLKTTTGGYDGKGVSLIKNEGQIEHAYSELGSGKVELMAEEFVDYEKEISVITCRGIDGTGIAYPVAENIHVHNILDTTIVPARIGEKTMNQALETAGKVMEILQGVGTFGIELFALKNGGVSVNEVAPRPHNSGHFTIEGCFANQFENHIRGIAGLPFGCAELICPTVMVNLLGESDGPAKLLGLEEAYRNPRVRVHFYGKPDSKKGRKMGHFTVMDKTVDETVRRAEALRKIIRITS